MIGLLDDDTLVRRAYLLPTLPASVSRMATLIVDPNAELKDILAVIVADQALAANVLRFANSCENASRWGVSNVKDALMRLGMGYVLGLAVEECVRELLDWPVPGYVLAAGQLRRHCDLAWRAAEATQPYSGESWPAASLATALLHDIGKVVIGPELSTDIRVVLRVAEAECHWAPHRAEREVLGADHGEIGGVVAQHWRLPDLIVRGIAAHHEPDADDLLGHIVLLADIVAHDCETPPAWRIDAGRKRKDCLDRLRIAPGAYEKICAVVSRSEQLAADDV